VSHLWLVISLKEYLEISWVLREMSHSDSHPQCGKGHTNLTVCQDRVQAQDVVTGRKG